MQLSVIMPAFNEEQRIEASLREIREFLPKHFESWEVIVVDDGSLDKTAEIVQSFEFRTPDQQLRLLKLKKNEGKGAAVKAGVAEAKGNYVLFMDADLSTPLEEIRRVMEPLEQGYGAAIGSRGQPDSNILTRQPFYREAMGKLFNRIVRVLVIDGIYDTQCGFKAFKKDVAKNIFSKLETKRFGFDVEVLLWAKKFDIPIKEVGVTWIDSPNSRVSPIKDSIEMLISLIKIRNNVNKNFFKYKNIRIASFQKLI